MKLSLKNKNRVVEKHVENLKTRSTEDDFHEYYEFFNELYYLNFDDLRQIIQAHKESITDSLFDEVLTDNYGGNMLLSQLGLMHTLIL